MVDPRTQRFDQTNTAKPVFISVIPRHNPFLSSRIFQKTQINIIKMRAYYYDNLPVSCAGQGPSTAKCHYLTPPKHQGDQRLPHDSNRAVDASYLESLGVHYKFCPEVEQVDEIAKERLYRNRDVITVAPAVMGDIYEEKVKTFFHEHLHEDEEIRYILDGQGFFDVRSEGDDWVRIRVEKGDLIIVPAGIYHRFTTDEENVST